MKAQEELAELAKDLAESLNINDENLAELRNTISQKQSRLNALLSAKESLNSSIKQYPDLFQKSYWTYIFHQNLQTLQNIESEISRYDQSIADDKSYLAFLEDKLDDVNGVGVDSEGRTLLMQFLSNGFFTAVDILLNNPNIDFNITDNNGWNALMHACAMPHIRYIERIIDATDNIRYIERIIDATDNINLGDQAGNTALHLLLKNAGMDSVSSDEIQAKTMLIVDKFLEKGVDLNTQNNDGHTPLTIACSYNLKYIANQWLENGLVDINFQDKSGKTTLFWMVMDGNGDMVDWLLAKGADRNITNADGALPIHVAAESGNVDMSFDYSLIEDYLNYDSFIKDDISIHSDILDDSLLYPSETAMLGDLSIDFSI